MDGQTDGWVDGWVDGVRSAQPTSPVTYFLVNSSSPCGFSSGGTGVTEEG